VFAIPSISTSHTVIDCVRYSIDQHQPRGGNGNDCSSYTDQVFTFNSTAQSSLFIGVDYQSILPSCTQQKHKKGTV